MRRSSLVLTVLIGALVTFARLGSAQDAVPLTILNVTLDGTTRRRRRQLRMSPGYVTHGERPIRRPNGVGARQRDD